MFPVIQERGVLKFIYFSSHCVSILNVHFHIVSLYNVIVWFFKFIMEFDFNANMMIIKY